MSLEVDHRDGAKAETRSTVLKIAANLITDADRVQGVTVEHHHVTVVVTRNVDHVAIRPNLEKDLKEHTPSLVDMIPIRQVES